MRTLLRIVLLFAVLFVAVGFLMSWWGPRVTINLPARRHDRRQLGAGRAKLAPRLTKTAVAVDKAAQVAGDARRAIENSGITAKIKAKMALDDTVKALDLDARRPTARWSPSAASSGRTPSGRRPFNWRRRRGRRSR